MAKELLRKANGFLADRLQLACDTVADIFVNVVETTKGIDETVVKTVEAFEPFDTAAKFVRKQGALFQKRKEARERLLS